MNLNYKAASFILIIIIMLSCSQKEGNTSEYEMPTDPDLKVYKFDSFGEDSILRYSDVYSEVKYIPLETTDESLIAEITKLEILENGDLIIHDYTKGSVLLFDKTGKFIRHIGHKGKGHDEYVAPKLMAYDKFNNQIIIYDSATSRLMFYDFHGNLVSVTEINMYISDFAVLDNDHLCLYLNYYDDFTKKQKGYNVKVIKRNGLIVSEHKEFGPEMRSFHPSCGHTFSQTDDGTYYRQAYSYLISSVDVNGLKELYYLDFGKHRIPTEWIPGKNMDIVCKVEKSEDIVDVNNLYFSKGKIIMEILRASRCTMYYLDIKDRNNDRYAGYGMINDIYGIEASQNLKAFKGDKVYFSIMPNQFVNAQSWVVNYNVGDNLCEKQRDYCIKALKSTENKMDRAFFKKYMTSKIILTQKDIDLINSIHEDDNPIIQVCTLKD